MYAKLIKIIALGLGAVVTTGIPSGPISTASGTRPALTVTEPYRLMNHEQAWQQGDKPFLQYRSAPDYDLVSYGTSQETSDLEEAPEPQGSTYAGSGKAARKLSGESQTEPDKPLTLPVMRITIAAAAPVVGRWVADRPRQVDACVAPVRVGTLFQPLASRFGYAETASYEWWLGDFNDTFLAKWPLLALGEDQKPPGGTPAANDPSAVPTTTSETGSNLVPEPTGILAIMAGLPGLMVIARRGRGRIV